MAGNEKPTENAEGPFEVENQFILRLPPVPAASLKTVVDSGVALRDRLTIQLENDMRHGTVRFDGWVLPCRIVDLPTIIESHKTLDGKNFYKTADICQMAICKEEIEEEKPEIDDAKKKEEKKDGKDKKFQWSHGITQPLKNVRKKRFRKTLKKKLVDAPEIEKEVKRLFRMDNEAINVRYDVVNVDDDRGDSKATNQPSPGNQLNNNSQSMDIVEHDLFGEVLSSSDEEDTRVPDSDDGSRLSIGNTRDQGTLRESMVGENRYVTEFPKGMLEGENSDRGNLNLSFDIAAESSNAAAAVAALQQLEEASTSIVDKPNDGLMANLNAIRGDISDIVRRRQEQESEIAGIPNLALKQRLQIIIDGLKDQESEKRRQYDEIFAMLNQ